MNVINNSRSAFPNLMARVSAFGSSSAKSAGVFHTQALLLPQFGFNVISFKTRRRKAGGREREVEKENDNSNLTGGQN